MSGMFPLRQNRKVGAMEAVSAVHEDPVCVSCGEYSEDGGYLCDKCQDFAMDALEDERAEALSSARPSASTTARARFTMARWTAQTNMPPI